MPENNIVMVLPDSIFDDVQNRAGWAVLNVNDEPELLAAQEDRLVLVDDAEELIVQDTASVIIEPEIVLDD